jgi:hypothetical protein
MGRNADHDTGDNITYHGGPDADHYAGPNGDILPDDRASSYMGGLPNDHTPAQQRTGRDVRKVTNYSVMLYDRTRIDDDTVADTRSRLHNASSQELGGYAQPSMRRDHSRWVPDIAESPTL